MSDKRNGNDIYLSEQNYVQWLLWIRNKLKAKGLWLNMQEVEKVPQPKKESKDDQPVKDIAKDNAMG